jgi:hypothetical protein
MSCVFNGDFAVQEVSWRKKSESEGTIENIEERVVSISSSRDAGGSESGPDSPWGRLQDAEISASEQGQ